MKRRRKDMRKLKIIMSTLEGGKPLAARYRNHKLSGNYNGRWECHIESDWLLIYQKTRSELIFERTGRHCDLFDE